MQFNPKQINEIAALKTKVSVATRYEAGKLKQQLNELIEKFTEENLKEEQRKSNLKEKYLKRFKRNAK